MFACHAANQCGGDGNRTSLIRKRDLIRSCTFSCSHVRSRSCTISFICSMVGFDGWIEARKGCVSLVVAVFVRECACVSDFLCLGV